VLFLPTTNCAYIFLSNLAEEIERVIGDKIIGQRGPIRSVASAIRLRENGWVDPDRPLVMLFLGSSGIGKRNSRSRLRISLTAMRVQTRPPVVSPSWRWKQSGAFMRIDMSEYQHDHTVSNLTVCSHLVEFIDALIHTGDCSGSPKGYVVGVSVRRHCALKSHRPIFVSCAAGLRRGRYLNKEIEEKPQGYVLLDEIEKAHPDVLTVFLQVFDDGRITDPKV